VRLALAIVLCSARLAAADGRFPATSTIHFRQGNDSDIIAGLTFGLAVSHDGGATWRWMCTQAVGYGGMYDPAYAYSASGAMFATTFNGLKVNRDGCTFGATPTGATFVSTDALGPDHALYISAADPADAKIYQSVDDGVSFPQSAAPGLVNDWWESLLVAPSDATRVYLSGYRFAMACDANSPVQYAPCTAAADCQDATHMTGACAPQKQLLLFESSTGGASFAALPGNQVFAGATSVVGLTTSINSVIDLVGVDHANASVLYARVSLENGTAGYGIYKIDTSTDTAWTRVYDAATPMVFLARSNGDLVEASPTGAAVSSNGGSTWTALTSPPQINCLAENSAGVVFACTANYGADGYGIMKSADLSTWTGVLHFQDLAGPVACAAGTVQHDTCVGALPETGQWCSLVPLLGLTSTEIDCSGKHDAPPDAAVDAMIDAIDAPPDAPVPAMKPKGCCDAGSAPTSLLGLVAMMLLRRRRR